MLDDRSRETKLVRLPIPAGIWPAKLGGEMLRWVSSVSLSNPVAGSCDALKSLPPRLRYLSDVRLKTAASRPPLCRRRPPRSRKVTRPPSQRTPAQRQQSVPARHDRNAVADAVVAENDRFSWSSAAAWSGKHGSELAIKVCSRRRSTSNNGSYSRWATRGDILAGGS
ncbi:Os01g0162900 [Oryza sativa Japonica Group]|uniref:Os01g0162900 protein n=2 Tax=Oryza sativa subsp. japonica TaxID=39947 RepID=Q0JQG5_ORYSJ|nr:Os01g0162900 [Oryza sativa Japonica Group]BAS70539.1 Os01g0162900 [Oryza sativa Japonica Group]|eukprot:NP_001042099.1 Os01g0162900 [Oryza sativa Japonica Group]